MQIHRKVPSLLQGFIENRAKDVLSGKADQNDLLNLLLKSNYDEIHENKNVGMPKEDIIEESKLFYFSGHKTTANLLTWSLILLSMHPKWQEKAREQTRL